MNVMVHNLFIYETEHYRPNFMGPSSISYVPEYSHCHCTTLSPRGSESPALHHCLPPQAPSTHPRRAHIDSGTESPRPPTTSRPSPSLSPQSLCRVGGNGGHTTSATTATITHYSSPPDSSEPLSCRRRRAGRANIPIFPVCAFPIRRFCTFPPLRGTN